MKYLARAKVKLGTEKVNALKLPCAARRKTRAQAMLISAIYCA
jgi:hypothetical protein